MSSKNRVSLAGILLLLACASPALASIVCDSPNRRSPSTNEVVYELREIRERFIREGRFVDIFPALYFSTTDAMLKETATMPAEEAQLLNEQIVLFYEAFEVNRRSFESKGPSAVESHWKSYYKEALRLEKKNGVTAFDLTWLTLDGVDAHLNDLPRSVRFQLRDRPGSAEAMKALYFGLDSLFPQIVGNFDQDVTVAFEKRGLSMPPFSTMNIGAVYVKHARMRAWEAATGNDKLRAKKPQPRLCRE